MLKHPFLGGSLITQLIPSPSNKRRLGADEWLAPTGKQPPAVRNCAPLPKVWPPRIARCCQRHWWCCDNGPLDFGQRSEGSSYVMFWGKYVSNSGKAKHVRCNHLVCPRPIPHILWHAQIPAQGLSSLLSKITNTETLKPETRKP